MPEGPFDSFVTNVDSGPSGVPMPTRRMATPPAPQPPPDLTSQTPERSPEERAVLDAMLGDAPPDPVSAAMHCGLAGWDVGTVVQSTYDRLTTRWEITAIGLKAILMVPVGIVGFDHEHIFSRSKDLTRFSRVPSEAADA